MRGFGVSLAVLSLSRGWTLTYWAYFLCSHSFSLVHPTRLRRQIRQTAESCCAVAAHSISRARNDRKKKRPPRRFFAPTPAFSVSVSSPSRVTSFLRGQELFQGPDSSVVAYDPETLTGLWPPLTDLTMHCHPSFSSLLQRSPVFCEQTLGLVTPEVDLTTLSCQHDDP